MRVTNTPVSAPDRVLFDAQRVHTPDPEILLPIHLSVHQIVFETLLMRF